MIRSTCSTLLLTGLLWCGLAAITAPMGGCAAGAIEDPHAVLGDRQAIPRRQISAMAVLDENPADEQYRRKLHRIIWVPGYTVPVREEALNRLAEYDQEGLHRTIRQQLPRMTMWGWLTRLCEIIGERGWDELTPALVSSWARPAPLVRDEAERPEYQALARLHGEERVADVVFQLFVESRSVAEQGLRTRCWDLLHRLGERERLVALIREADVAEDDAMLIDLRAGAEDLGIVPHNREEILWLRELRKPERAEFWSQAVQAIGTLPDERRVHLELRDLPIIVAAHRHEPDLLERSRDDLYQIVRERLRGARHHSAAARYAGLGNPRGERLSAWRDELTWGDLAAILMALRAFEVPQMRDHIFDYAERDMNDETTEYGGVIRLDDRSRFEIIEFPPRIRQHANKFIAPQEMFEAGYTSLFHFHNHAQRYRNREYASPGLGDLQYAGNTRANCLVFTFINRDTLNMDFYRHGNVVVDLGEIRR